MELLGTFLGNILITAIAYLLVPIIILISGKKLTLPQIKKTVIINGICVWLIFMIIRIESGIDGTSFAVLLWSAVGYSILKRKCLIEANAKEIYEPNENTNPKNVVKVLAALLAISVIFNIIQLINPKDDAEVSEKLEFYDEHIVFVIDGYGDYYYTYDQMIYATRNDDYYEFWAYNEEQAIDLGYTAYRK